MDGMHNQTMPSLGRSIRNHSRGFVSDADIYKATKKRAAMEKQAASKKHKKLLSKARRARRPIGVGEDQADPQTQLANLSYEDGKQDELMEWLESEWEAILRDEKQD